MHSEVQECLTAAEKIRNPRRLAAFSEERLDERGAFRSKQSRGNFNLMIQSRVGEDLETGANRTALRIVAAIHDPRDASLNNRPCTHAARLDRNVQGRRSQPVIAEFPRAFAQHHNFRVRGGVAIPDRAIARTRDYFAVSHQDCADRDLSSQRRRASLFKGQLHEFEIVIHKLTGSAREYHATKLSAEGSKRGRYGRTRTAGLRTSYENFLRTL
jgi:hypothetical protein